MTPPTPQVPDFSDWTVVTPPATTPDCEPHTPSPPGYVAHAEWAEEMAATYTVRRCRGCMRFMIWELKAT